MDKKSGWMVRNWRGMIGLLCPLLLWMAMGEAMGETVPFYRVGVETIVKLPVPAGKEARAIGMEQARKAAWERLLRRMFTRGDLESKKKLLDELGQNIHRGAERLVVVGESQRGNTLVMAVEVIFPAKEINAALSAQGGLLYNETLHPPVLFLVRSLGGSREEAAQSELLLQKSVAEAAKGLSIPVVAPLGDMEDMNHLAWELMASGDVAMRQWVSSRYGTDQVWGVISRTTPPATGQKTPTYTIQAELLGRTVTTGKPTALEPLQAEVTSNTPPNPCTERGNAPECPFAVLAQTLLQRVADQWIQFHTINPSLHLMAHLRVMHGPKLAQFSQFVTKLRAMPGVAKLKFMEERATESSMLVEFQGDDPQLRRLLTQLGTQVMEGGEGAMAGGGAGAAAAEAPIPQEAATPSPEAAPSDKGSPSAVAPVSRVEMVLRLL
ncbi:MAG: DUF2066 domain-containing protein [Magnetococcales bacterium]|nr:DUF2066 domain-containing protein [Magnetococcales bacterium]